LGGEKKKKVSFRRAAERGGLKKERVLLPRLRGGEKEREEGATLFS